MEDGPRGAPPSRILSSRRPRSHPPLPRLYIIYPACLPPPIFLSTRIPSPPHSSSPPLESRMSSSSPHLASLPLPSYIIFSPRLAYFFASPIPRALLIGRGGRSGARARPGGAARRGRPRTACSPAPPRAAPGGRRKGRKRRGRRSRRRPTAPWPLEASNREGGPPKAENRQRRRQSQKPQIDDDEDGPGPGPPEAENGRRRRTTTTTTTTTTEEG